jgi:hypothetical protein
MPASCTGWSEASPPGIPFGPWTVPLNPDFYTQLMIDYANQGPFGTTLGVLDSFGRGNASLTLPPSLPIAGIIAHHAYVTLDVNLNVAFISEAASVEFTP